MDIRVVSRVYMGSVVAGVGHNKHDLLDGYNNWAWITIHGTGDSSLLTNNKEVVKELGCKYVLDLKFDDISGKDIGIVFNNKMAKEVIKFLDKINHKVDLLVCNCTAGISRSGAVGRFAQEYLDIDRGKFAQQNRQIIPNIHVLNTLRREAGFYEDYESLWQNS